MRASYLDSSAIVKLVVAEPETPALRAYLRRRRPLVSSALARVEVLRALLPAGQIALTRGRVVLRRLDLVRLNGRILDTAGTLEPAHLCSLDAIHVATALALGADLAQVVTYDERMVEAVTQLGLRAVLPS